MTTRKRFSKQFKLQAVELLEQSDKPATEVARELGVMRNQLYKWQHELREKGEDKAFRGPGRNAATQERSEVVELRRRLAQLEEENAILKKAAAYFAKELP
ncbi:transposase [Salinisphaera hydrothermalis]|uniref:transposase n=1 Tax=Salinisphaera hydrothermalis TaxID=563188 RepID=UPI00334039E0